MTGTIAVFLLASSGLFGCIYTVAAQGGPARQPDCIPGVRGFTCDDGSCIDYGFDCNGFADCADGTDEKSCKKSNADYFRCRNQRRLPTFYRCDGDDNCGDGTDEKYCDGIGKPLPIPPVTCAADQFMCGIDQCIPNYQRCDLVYDCRNSADEMNCPCNGTEHFQCKNGRCIDSRMRCDRENNCGDRSDEAGCTTYACNVNENKCPDGTCVALNRRCKSVYR